SLHHPESQSQQSSRGFRVAEPNAPLLNKAKKNLQGRVLCCGINSKEHSAKRKNIFLPAIAEFLGQFHTIQVSGACARDLQGADHDVRSLKNSVGRSSRKCIRLCNQIRWTCSFVEPVISEILPNSKSSTLLKMNTDRSANSRRRMAPRNPVVEFPALPFAHLVASSASRNSGRGAISRSRPGSVRKYFKKATSVAFSACSVSPTRSSESRNMVVLHRS